jgi:hypothetical protein
MEKDAENSSRVRKPRKFARFSRFGAIDAGWSLIREKADRVGRILKNPLTLKKG